MNSSIKKHFVLYCLLLLLLQSCQYTRAVDIKVSRFYFYSEDQSTILYQTDMGIFNESEYKEVTTDVENIKIIGNHFAKDSKSIYYTYKPLLNVDYASFVWDDKINLPKDKEHVYLIDTASCDLRVIQYADPATYEILHNKCTHYWSRDKNYYYYKHIKVDADRATFSFEYRYFACDKNYIFWVKEDKIHKTGHSGNVAVISITLLRDDKKLYNKRSCDGHLFEIGYTDINTFIYYNETEDVFGIDNDVYIKGVKMICDKASFEIITYPYSKDKDHVYYNSDQMPEVDRKTFVVINSELSKDSKHVYKKHKVLDGYTPDTFLPDEKGRYPTDSNYGKGNERSYRSSGGDDDDD